MSARKTPLQDVKILYGNAASRCAFPECRRDLVLEEKGIKTKQVGEIAHIVAHSHGGPRGDNNIKNLDCYENWILLCPTCHKIIDRQPEKYSAEKLQEIKKNHESWVAGCLKKEIVTFKELEEVAQALLECPLHETTNFSVTPIYEKIDKNNLGTLSRNLLVTGMMHSTTVEAYLKERAKEDNLFPERLKSGFRREYLELARDSSGDKLFLGMLAFTYKNSGSFEYQATGLATLAYLFHLCEVFEK